MLDFVPESGQSLCQRLPSELSHQLKCLDISTRCSCAVFANGVRNMSSEQERSLCIIVQTYDHQLDDLEAQLPPSETALNTDVAQHVDLVPDSNALHTTLCRLHIRVLYFYKDLAAPHDGCFSKLQSTACSFIDQVAILCDKSEFCPASPLFVTMGLITSCCTLLRLLKSIVSRDLDVERSKSCLFSGINMLKRVSIHSDDMAIKCATIVNQLWNSSKAFRKLDGTEHTTLRIRSRLVMAPILDAVWWWREEYDPQHKMFSQDTETTGNFHRANKCPGNLN